MKLNAHFEISDADRNRFAILVDGKQSKRLATRADLCAFFAACLDKALELDPELTAEPLGEMRADPDVPVSEFTGVRVLADLVIDDIDRGAWSFLDSPDRNHG